MAANVKALLRHVVREPVTALRAYLQQRSAAQRRIIALGMITLLGALALWQLSRCFREERSGVGIEHHQNSLSYERR